MKIRCFTAFVFVIILNQGAYAETLSEKVARNAANCLTGHIATNSKKYQSGETAQYIILIRNNLGAKKAGLVIRDAENNLKTSMQILGHTKKEEGGWLIEKFCPGVDEILKR